ncbi:MAG: cytochrome c oxidase subunit II [Rhodospirillales bacterium]|nr:cytochrome c oxidase subunit II [Rhodospirillales bacterium]
MRDVLHRWLSLTSAAGLGIFAFAQNAFAEDVLGEAKPWQINFQNAFSPVMERVHEFHNLLLVIITAIVLLVLAILGYVIFRFNARSNPVPSQTAHNTLLEFVWTVVPVIILAVIAVPSITNLYYSAQTPPKYDLTLKVTAHQWYWTYNYPDNGDFTFDSIPVAEDDLKPGQPRLLTVDNPVVLPVGATIQVLIASDDVIHDWAVPSLGLKKDALPGRINETWVRIEKEGTFYGMCSELCGVNHYFMPIQVRGVSKPEFDAWVEQAKQTFAVNGHADVNLASGMAEPR